MGSSRSGFKDIDGSSINILNSCQYSHLKGRLRGLSKRQLSCDSWLVLSCPSCVFPDAQWSPPSIQLQVLPIYLVLSQPCLAVLQHNSSCPGGTRIDHFSFLSFQRGSCSNSCENGTKKRETIWPEAGRLLPVRDSNVVLMDQLSLGPQALLLFRGIHKWTKRILPPQIIGSITA